MTRAEMLKDAEALVVDAEEMCSRVAASNPSRSYLAEAVLEDAIGAYVVLLTGGDDVQAAALYTRSLLMSEALRAPLQ